MNGKSINHGQENNKSFLEEAKGNPFIVPRDYFDSLTDRINNRIAVNEAVEESFAVPKDYFEELAGSIYTRIAETDLKDKVPSIDYTVPEGYFEDLSSRINDRIARLGHQKEEGIVVPMKRKNRFAAIYKYAAVAFLFLGLGAITYNRLYYHELSFNEYIKEVSDREILSYLEYYTQAGDMADYLLDDISAESISIEKTDFSKEEIEDYLSQNF